MPGVKTGPPAEQDTPLNVPKKTKLFIEVAQRERDQYLSMHKLFHMDLAKLRFRCAQNYLRTISEGYAPVSYASGANIKLMANVRRANTRSRDWDPPSAWTFASPTRAKPPSTGWNSSLTTAINSTL